MTVRSTIPLTMRLNVEDGSHLLYFYVDEAAYIENAVSFIHMALEHNHKVVYIDSAAHWQRVSEQLQLRSSGSFDAIRYLDSYEFYRMYEDFCFERVLGNLKTAVDPFVQEGTSFRLWGQVDWVPQAVAADKVATYERSCDVCVSELGFLTVCAYNANAVPSSVQLAMMETHEYLMTDTALTRSNLYEKQMIKSNYRFPSLRAQARLESEADLIREKLDFVHVVSHEVRNPLTVIKSYASLLMNGEFNEARLDKLKTIVDYSNVIDYEISHILETEETLASEPIWYKQIVNVQPILEEVLTIMVTKARTQNIHLVAKICISPSDTMLGNKMGLKLILSNVISNAIQYSYEAGVVEVAVAIDEEAKLTFQVSDAGVGMSEEQKQRLFRKHEKQDDEHHGQGIGLYIVKKLVDHLEGTIEVASQPQHGTCVTIHLPMFCHMESFESCSDAREVGP